MKELAVSVVIGGALGKSFVGSVETARQTSRRLGKEWRETNKKLGATKELTQYKTKLTDLKAKQKALGGSNKKIDKGIADLNRRYKAAKREVKGYGIAVGDVVRHQEKLTKSLAKTERQQTALRNKNAAKSRFGALKGRAIGALGAAYGAGRLFNQSFQLEDQELYLRTVINAKDGDRDAAIGRARANAKKLAATSLASESELLNIEYELNSAGLDEDVARAGAELTHKLSKITRGNSIDVAAIVGTTFNTMGNSLEGTTEEKMQRIGSVLAKTQFKFQIRDFNQLGASMELATASAVGAQLPLEQTASIIGELNTAGLKGTRAGTAFSAMLRNLTKGSDELGYEIVRNDDGELNLLKTLGNIKGSLDGLDIDERGDVLQKTFGDEGKRAVIPLLNDLEKVKRNFKDINKGANLNSEYKEFAKSASGQWTMFTQNLLMVGTTLTGTLLPAVNAVLKPIGSLMGWVSKGIQKFPVIGYIIGGLVTGFALYTVGLGLATAATWAWNTALLANPVGLIVAGVALLGAGIYALWENWDTVWSWIEKKVQSVWKIIKWTPLGLLIQGVGAGFKAVKSAFNYFTGDDEETEGDLSGGTSSNKDKGKLGNTTKALVIGTAIATTPLAAENAKLDINQYATTPLNQLVSQESLSTQPTKNMTDQRDFSDNSSYVINIKTEAGMDNKAIASVVQSEIKRAKQNTNPFDGNNHSALYDEAE